MNAFQSLASYVATSLLVPKKHYTRVSGLQSLSGSIVTILAPALGNAVLAFGGLKMVLAIDLTTFLFAFLILLFYIKIPQIAHVNKAAKESFLQSCMSGINFLRKHTALLRIILFFAFINFISKMGSYGVMSVLVLSRTLKDQAALGIVQTAVAIGTLVGSVCVTLMKPSKNRIKVIFFTCGISFIFGDMMQGITHTLPLWVIAAFASNVPMAFLNANLTSIMRTNVPIEMQGRVFSARDTIQYSTMPIGLFLGGILADHAFEPFMTTISPMQNILSTFFGVGKGSGIAMMFFLVGLVGFVTSFLALRNPVYKSLNQGKV